MAWPQKTFYQNGLRFTCQGSGNCCLNRGDYSYVHVPAPERERLASHLGLSVERFTRDYCRAEGGYWYLKNAGPACIFLEDHRCRVYPARPRQCRTWPFWPSTLNPVTWEKEVRPCCPGAGQGRLYTAAEIEEILQGKQDVPGVGESGPG